MLFASTFRRGGENNNLNNSSSNNYNNNDNHQEYRRRSLLVRRHTCSVLDPSKISTGAALLAPLGLEMLTRVFRGFWLFLGVIFEGKFFFFQFLAYKSLPLL